MMVFVDNMSRECLEMNNASKCVNAMSNMPTGFDRYFFRSSRRAIATMRK